MKRGSWFAVLMTIALAAPAGLARASAFGILDDDRYAWTSTSGGGGDASLFIQHSDTQQFPNACVEVRGVAALNPAARTRKPNARTTWLVDTGCGDITVSLDPLLESASASGIISSTVRGTLDGETVYEPSTITISITWTATGPPTSDGGWLVQPSPPQLPGVYALADLSRSALSSGSIVSDHLGDAGGGSNVAAIGMLVLFHSAPR